MTLNSVRLLVESNYSSSNSSSSEFYVGITDGDQLYEFDPAVFWGVNGFIGFMLLCLIAWCFCFGGKDSLTEWTNRQREAEIQYQRSVLRRRQAEEEAKKDTPAQRIRKLKRSFERCGVTMIVKEGDIVKSLPEGSESHFDDTLRDGVSVNGSMRNSISIAMGVIADLEDDEDQQSKADNGSTETADNGENGDNGDNVEKGDNDDNFNDDDNGDNDEENQKADEAAENMSVGSGHGSIGSGLRSLGGSIASAGHGSMVGSILSAWTGGSGHPTGYVILRPQPTTNKNNKNYFHYNRNKNNQAEETPKPRRARYAANGCAVCLGSFELGEKIVWSSNDKCQHVFHEECIIEWLVKMQNGTPCPCCRQEFTDLQEFRKEKRIRWAAGETFNFEHIGL